MEKQTKKVNDKIVVIGGISLIILVFGITIARSMNIFPFNKKELVIGNDLPESKKEDETNYVTISMTDLQKKIFTGKKLLLLDVRPFEYYIEEHIVDSVNIPLTEFPLGEKYDKSTEVIVISDSIEDDDIKNAVAKLAEENFSNVRVLAGGLNQWKNLGGATVRYGDPTEPTDQAKVNYVTTEQVRDALKSTRLYVLDVRNKELYEKSHIPGAINIPIEELEKRRFEIKTNKQVVAVGINELQEFQAAVQLHDMLLVKMHVMSGSMTEWEEKKYPLETKK